MTSQTTATHTENGGQDGHSRETSNVEERGRTGDHSHALQVVCLGSGGGPSEDNVTGFLVRSLSSGWSRGSLLAVDAGSHLSAITRILQNHFPLYSKEEKTEPLRTSLSPTFEETDAGRRKPTILQEGPFAGVKFHNESARANALHLLHTYISCYLITHPHLDHLSGFAINTAALTGRSRPKTLAALPSTVDAVKRHIFNDAIWPNLSDEDGGVGFVTFQRLKEGGDPMVGEGEARGYIDVCDGLSVKAFSVSHGVCTKTPPTHQHRGSISNGQDLAAALNGNTIVTEPANMTRSLSINDGSAPGTPGAHQHRHSLFNIFQPHQYHPASPCVVDSTAYFLRDEETAKEVLMFGDVEPDSVSISPRNERVWAEAARKVVGKTLKAIFIECSYTDAVADETLFGHLCPRHVIAELQVLADMVHEWKVDQQDSNKKRKHSVANGSVDGTRKRSRGQASDTSRTSHDADSVARHEEALSPRAAAARNVSAVPHHMLPAQTHRTTRLSGHINSKSDGPALSGVTIVIIHIKDTFKDGPPVSETVLQQLQEHEEALKESGVPLGCKFVISKCGESYEF